MAGRVQAQNLDGTLGKVVRINADGSIPSDNPFVNTAGAKPEIWSLGHRNIQSAALDAQGRLVSLEVAPIGSLLASVREAVELHRIPLATALAAATASPAAIWGLDRKGGIAPGLDADLILLDRETLALRWTMAGGRL